MKRELVWILVLCVALTPIVVCGCSKDPQINVTPFVLKPSEAPPAQADVAGEMVMGTRPYEAAVAGASSASR